MKKFILSLVMVAVLFGGVQSTELVDKAWQDIIMIMISNRHLM